MKIKAKITILALLCIIAMTIDIIPASAMGHTCIEIEKPGTKVYQNSYKEDGGGHLSYYRVQTCCQICGNSMGYKEGADWESHTWGYWEDLGHVGLRVHRFRRCCGKCNGGEVISIFCEVDVTGYHNTP